MKENIFEGAAFGQMFECRDGSRAVFIGFEHHRDGEISAILADEALMATRYFYLNGKIHFGNGNNLDADIIGRYHQEPIDEAKLDKLANQEYPIPPQESNGFTSSVIHKVFKDGYKKAYHNLQDEYKYKLREKVYDFLNGIKLEEYVEKFDDGELDFTDEFYNELDKAMGE